MLPQMAVAGIGYEFDELFGGPLFVDEQFFYGILDSVFSEAGRSDVKVDCAYQVLEFLDILSDSKMGGAVRIVVQCLPGDEVPGVVFQGVAVVGVRHVQLAKDRQTLHSPQDAGVVLI